MSRFHDRVPGGWKGYRWRRFRLQVFERDGWRCRSCGRAGRLECDHIVPLSRGGAPFDLGNAQALCRGCHVTKSRGERPPKRESELRRRWRALVEAI